MQPPNNTAPEDGNTRIRAALTAEVLSFHAASAVAANLASVVLAVLLFVALGGALPRNGLVAWALVLSAVLAARLSIHRRHQRQPARCSVPGWIRAYRAGAALHGVAWGAVAFVLPDGAPAQDLAALAYLLAGLACGGLALTLYDFRAGVVFAVPVLLPLSLRVSMATEPTPRLVLVAGALVVMLFAIFAVASRRNARELRSLVVARLSEADGADKARRNEALLRLIFDHVGLGLVVFDAERRLTATNSRAREMWGLPEGALERGAPLEACLLAVARLGAFGPGDPRALVAAHLPGFLSDTPDETPLRLLTISGRTLETHRSALPGGGLALLHVDVTAAMKSAQLVEQAHAQLAEKSRVLAATLDSLSQGVLSLDAHGRVNAWNRRALELLELPQALMQGRPTMASLVAWQRAAGQFGPSGLPEEEPLRSQVERIAAGETEALRRHYRRRKPDGALIDVQTHLAPDGSLVRTYTDVTASVAAEHALRESETRFRALADAAPALIGLSDAEGRPTWFNQRWLEYTGRTMREELVLDWSARIHPEDLRRCQDTFRAAYGERRRYSVEFRLRRADGGWGWIADSGIPRHLPDGRFDGFVSYGWEISERKAAEAALIAAKDEAERANRAKSEFLSRMSHELRTPLNAVLGFGQLLDTDPHEPLTEGQHARVQEMLRGGRHLLALINEVLDLARIESGTLQMRLEVLDLHALVESALRLVAPVAERRQITLTMDWSEPDARVRADGLRLKQVVLNLLSNAIKYNRDGGSVRVGCARVGGQVRLSVADRGPGISEHHRARLFQAFERLHADQHAVEGAGIGLALSKWLVELMDGEIGVDSEEGVGSTFWVGLRPALGEVPAVAAPADAPPATPSPESPTEPSAAPAPPAAEVRTVLYIEDNPVNVVLMESMLAHRPRIRLLTADRPAHGLALAEREQPDLVLLDIQLPGMDGYEVLRRLRSHAGTERIPVVAVSANALPGDLDQARRAGFDDYLTKPLDMNRLLALVDRELTA